MLSLTRCLALFSCLSVTAPLVRAQTDHATPRAPLGGAATSACGHADCAHACGLRPTARDLRPGGPAVVATEGAVLFGSGGPCDAAGFAALSGQALVDALADAPSSCLDSLWSFDGDVATVIGGNVVDLAAATMTAEAATLIPNAARLEALAYYFQIAFYHEFYQGGVSYDGATFGNAQNALVAVAGSADFFDESQAVRDLRSQWAVSIDSTNGSHLVLAAIEAMLARYLANPAYANDYDERLTVYRCLFTIARQIYNQDIALGAGSPWYSAISPGLIDELDDIALDYAYTDDTEYLVLNALWVFSRFSFLDAATRAVGHSVLSTAYQNFPTYSGPWFRALVDLDAFYGAQLADGTPLDIEAIRQAVEAIALPNTWTFDQGRIAFRTPLSRTRCEELYDAIKEVTSQFFRKCGHLDPVPGDDNETIRLVVYGSPADYALYQPFLYGYSTNNGGIFIEGIGTLFTYERTPQESIYTLEELLRHEYVHYLDSRYLVTGGFYESGGLYVGGRLDWWSEGLAEFLVGSSRRQGVLPRRILLERIDGDASRMSVAEIVNATYGSGFGFYRYAGTFFDFLDDQRRDVLRDLFDAVRGNDAGVFDALVAGLAADAGLQLAYDAWLNARIAEIQAHTGTFAEDVPTQPTPMSLPPNNASVVRSATVGTLPVMPTPDFEFWDARWRYTNFRELPTGGAAPHDVRAMFETDADAMLDALQTQGVNWGNAVAWFGDVSTVGNLAIAELVIEGPFQPTASDVDVPAAPLDVIATAGAGRVELRWLPSAAEDLAGYRVYRSASTGGPYAEISSRPRSAPRFTDSDPIAGASAFYVVAAEDAAGNLSGFSPEAAAEVAASVLVVNGHYSADTGYAQSYFDELDAREIHYQLWNPAVDGPVTAQTLLPYVDGLVIWPVGYLYQSQHPEQLGAAQRAAIEAYLAAGGSLVISGAYKASQLQGTTLFTDWFHASHVQNVVGLSGLSGVPGQVLGDGATMTLTYDGYTAELDLSAPAQSAFAYQNGTGSGSVQSSGTAVFTVDAGYKVAYLAFPFADLTASDRGALMGRVLDWTLPPTDFRLSIEPGLAGATNTISIERAPPLENAFLMIGSTGAALPVPCAGMPILGIADPNLLVVLPTDAAGAASVAVPVSGWTHNLTAYFQVGVLPSCRFSNVVLTTF